MLSLFIVEIGWYVNAYKYEMRYTELTELQAVSKIRDFQRYPEAISKEPGREWNPADNWIEQADAIAAKYEFTRLGKGEFAGVYGKPNSDYIIKLFATEDYGFQEYLNFIRTHQSNPYVPKLKGNLVKVTPSISAVRMERLRPLASDHEKQLVQHLEHLVHEYHDILEYWKDPNAHDEIDYDSKTLDILRYFPNLRTDANLQEICEYLTQHHGDVDIHKGNAMMRGKQLVITDPLAFL